MKTKRIINSILKGQRAKYQLQLRFFLCLSLLLLTVFALGAILDPDAASGCMIGFGGTSFASMMAIGSVDDLSDKYTSGSNIAYKVHLIEISQLDRTITFPKPNANREVSTLPMLDGQYMQYFEAHDFPTYSSTAEKGDITSSGTNNFEIIMAGVSDQMFTFIEEHIGGKFILIFKEIEAAGWEILGSDERPVILKSIEVKNDKDGRYVTCKFERTSVNQYNHYTGAIITAPAATHTAGSEKLAIKTGQNLYSIPNGSSAAYTIKEVSGITASDKGRIITLKGLGSDKSASIAESSCYILEDGATWTAKAGSSISFRIFDATTLVEVPGSRTQTA